MGIAAPTASRLPGWHWAPTSRVVQVPQYLLEHAIKTGQGADCSIVCTQPRRIAAVSVAERVPASLVSSHSR